MKISKIYAIEILDSRANPTLKTFVELENRIRTSALVPSGAVIGKYKTVDLRDNDTSRYNGKGVLNAVNNVNNVIAKNIIGFNIESINEIDRKMIEIDKTENKSNLGANTLLSVSLALSRALSSYNNKPLWKTINEYYFTGCKTTFPRLMVNIVSGGKYTNWNFDISEFIIIPKTNQPSESVRLASQIFHNFRNVLKQNNFSTLLADDGGHSPSNLSKEQVLDYIKRVSVLNYMDEFKNETSADFAIDIAATELYENGYYEFRKESKKLTTQELINYYISLRQKYNLFSFEDPFAEDDWEGFKKLTGIIGNITLIIGDDLYATNLKRIKKGIEEKATNAVLIKPNRAGTVLETVESVKLAKQGSLKIIISHGASETEDSFIADFAVACGADFLKAGSILHSEHLAKYNRLMEIEKLEL